MHILYHHRTAGDRVELVHIMGMVRALRQMGHTVDICSPPGCDPERTAPNRKGSARRNGTLRTRLKRFARRAPPILFEGAELSYNLYSLAQMTRLFRRRRPDLLYERATANSIAPTLLARRWGVPIVQEVNVTADVGRLRPLVLGDLTRRIERWVGRRADLVVTVSEEFRRRLAASGYPAERALICQNAADPDVFGPDAVEPAQRPPNVPSDAVLVGYVGAFVPWHRPDLLVEAARRLASGYPEARWLLVGDGVARPRIEELLGRWGLTDRFWMPGAVPHRAVPSYLAAMDAAVLPDSNQFGSPMKLFEYMSMARAVVAPRVPAVCEVLNDEEQGLLFEPGGVSSLCAALERVLGDAPLRERLGRSARRHVLRNYTWRRNAERVLSALGLAPERRMEGNRE
ncbi:MAG: glycosyltransferase family 4 protein [Candidatus Brocadiia bacterium]